MENKSNQNWSKYQAVIVLLFLLVVGFAAYYQKGKLHPVPSGAASMNQLSWSILEPQITVRSEIYRSTTGFLEDPVQANFVASVPSSTTTYNDTGVSAGVTYYYSIFLIDDAEVAFDPSYYELVPTTVPGGGGGGGSGGGSGGSGGGGGGGVPTIMPPPTSGTRLVNSNGTFFFVEGGYRKGITSPGIMYACGFEFKDAKPATSSDMALPMSMLLPCTGSLVKSNEDKTVYLVSGNTRYAFTSANVFLGLGFKFSSVLLVTNPELQALGRGADLNNASAAHLPGLDININGTVYWIDSNSQKHPYPSLEVYNSWHKDGDFSTVVPANANDMGLTTGSNVVMRVF